MLVIIGGCICPSIIFYIIMKKRHEQKLIILSIGLLIAFSIPVSLLFNSEKEVFGYPMILIYIFAVWMASIIISFVIVKKYDE
ncbi:hypothetical protein J3D55_002097 [Chryseobacterium ginsenosidimutans]|uniref:hypothetical protein n=1 Tax=Chryseobacterium ginsenosidimutans TaxID=687846 RepID=UPI00286DE890|nr:hypothetical protein [Chryseobacterium ginsenosidimutans]MCS3869181.1 hypothetical protein [Chryseobacterium ginsenosidimutans]